MAQPTQAVSLSSFPALAVTQECACTCLARAAADCPREARVLAPMITREIVFRLLMGEQGARLQHSAVLGGHADRIACAIQRLRNDYNKPLRIDGLARELGMSLSGFHNYSKAVTAMSPLQFQKHSRLQEARRLMLGEDMDAASAGYRVGYEDALQFSHEYKRFFGEPPMRDMGRMRQASQLITEERSLFTEERSFDGAKAQDNRPRIMI